MGRVIFLNQQAKEYHEKMGIKIQNPPELKVIQGAKAGIVTSRKKVAKPTKAKRKTLGQRIYESMQDESGSGPKGIA